MDSRILVVDDDPYVLKTIEVILREEGFYVQSVSGGEQAIRIFSVESFHVVITDIKMPGMDGLELARRLKQLDEDVEMIILTGFATIDNTVSALKDCRAFDYLVKPMEKIEELVVTVSKALENRRLRIENRSLLKRLKEANENLERKVEERTRILKKTNLELDALNAIAMTVNQSLDKTIMLKMVVRRICEVLGVSRCSIILFDDRKQEGTIEAGYDEFHFPGYRVGEKIILTLHPPLEQLTKTHQPIIIEDALLDSRTSYMKDFMARLGIRCIAFMPLIYHNDIIGAMVLDRLAVDPLFSSSEINLATTVAEQITVGVKNALLYDQVKSQLKTLEQQDHELKAYAALLQEKVDERVRELRRLDRLSALGELSAAIAHEIRNPLTGISSNAQLLKDNMRSNREDHELLMELSENILVGVNRIEKIIIDIIDFAKPRRAVFAECSLDEIVSRTIRLIDPQCRQKRVRLEVESAGNLPTLLLDQTQIQQVLVNLILNALHATSPNGTISLSLSKSHPEQVRRSGDQEYVLLSISDTGTGIRPEILDKIFDPFFTTRPDGAGLGLSISDTILKEHKVDIHVNSELGKGTSFVMQFPVRRVSDEKGRKYGAQSHDHR